MPHLAPHPQSSEAEAAACVRCLRLIGTERARVALDAYRTSEAWPVIEELAESLSPLTLPVVLNAAQDARRWQEEVPASIKGRIRDLAPLQGLSALQRLSLNQTPVSDLAPLQGLSTLQRLSLNGTRVSDLAPLQGLSALQWLSLNGTRVSDLAPLQGLAELQVLYLNQTQVTPDEVARLKAALARKGNRLLQVFGVG